jgi:hypothetical protein
MNRPADVQLTALRLYLYQALRTSTVLADYLTDDGDSNPLDRVCATHQGYPPVVFQDGQLRRSHGALPCVGVYGGVGGTFEGVDDYYKRTVYAQYAALSPAEEMVGGVAHSATEKGDALVMAALGVMRGAIRTCGDITTEWGIVPLDKWMEPPKLKGWKHATFDEIGVSCVQLELVIEHDYPTNYILDPGVSWLFAQVGITTEVQDGNTVTLNAKIPT